MSYIIIFIPFTSLQENINLEISYQYIKDFYFLINSNRWSNFNKIYLFIYAICSELNFNFTSTELESTLKDFKNIFRKLVKIDAEFILYRSKIAEDFYLFVGNFKLKILI